MPLQFQNYAQAYANPVQTVARDRSQSIKDIGSAIDEMIAKSDLAKEKTTRSNLLSDVDNKKVQVIESEINQLNNKLKDLEYKKLQLEIKINDTKKLPEPIDNVLQNGTSTDTENTNTSTEFDGII